MAASRNLFIACATLSFIYCFSAAILPVEDEETVWDYVASIRLSDAEVYGNHQGKFKLSLLSNLPNHPWKQQDYLLTPARINIVFNSTYNYRISSSIPFDQITELHFGWDIGEPEVLVAGFSSYVIHFKPIRLTKVESNITKYEDYNQSREFGAPGAYSVGLVFGYVSSFYPF